MTQIFVYAAEILKRFDFLLQAFAILWVDSHYEKKKKKKEGDGVRRQKQTKFGPIFPVLLHAITGNDSSTEVSHLEDKTGKMDGKKLRQQNG